MSFGQIEDQLKNLRENETENNISVFSEKEKDFSSENPVKICRKMSFDLENMCPEICTCDPKILGRIEVLKQEVESLRKFLDDKDGSP